MLSLHFLEAGHCASPPRPCSPTTTGKIERFHRILREEFLDHVVPFESLTAAQDAVDGWVDAYNHQRPHQALGMATRKDRQASPDDKRSKKS